MKHLKLFLALCLMPLLNSCDFGGYYYYYVENKLTDKVITVKVEYPSTNMDSIFVIAPNEKKLIGKEETGIIAKHEHPEDVLAHYCSLGKIQILIGNTLLNKQFRERAYWHYSTENRIGNYFLIIDENFVRNNE